MKYASLAVASMLGFLLLAMTFAAPFGTAQAQTAIAKDTSEAD